MPVRGGGADVGVARADEGFFLAEVDLDAPAPEVGLEEFFEAHVWIGAEEFGPLAQAVCERGDDEKVVKDGVFAIGGGGGGELEVVLGLEEVGLEGGDHQPKLDLDRLSNILEAFNEQFGTLFNNADRIFTRIKEEIASLVASDQAFRNARENTPAAARIEHHKTLARVMLTLLKNNTQIYKQFVENGAFRRAVSDFVYPLTAA